MRKTERTPVACGNCKTTFVPRKPTAGNGKPYQFCSRDCSNAAKRGGIDKPVVKCAECGKEKTVPPWLVQRNARHFCSRTCRGKWISKNLVGERAYNWRGGVETISRWLHAHSQMRKWSNTVLELANHTCERCGSEAEHAHHKIAVEALLATIFDPANGEALCANCHVEHHR